MQNNKNDKLNGFLIMARLTVLVKPLIIYMCLAIIMGLIGHLCASFITVFGSLAVIKIAGIDVRLSLNSIFIIMFVIAVLRGILRYAEQSCNHFIAFKLLAIIRDKVFAALRRLTPAKLECRDRGNLIALITSDIELLEVFYAHTISPVIIAILFGTAMVIFIGHFHIILGLIALLAYLTVGFFMPLFISQNRAGADFRNKAGLLSSYVLEGLYGFREVLQFGIGNQRLNGIRQRTDELLSEEEEQKKATGINTALTNSFIFLFDIAMLVTAIALYHNKSIGFDGAVLAVMALMSSFGPFVALAMLGTTLTNTLASGKRVLDLLDEEPILEEITDGVCVEFDGAFARALEFSYDNEKILDKISLDIEKNEIVGISGKSGSGKSTFLKLLMRFWERDGGEISISGTDINRINTKSLKNIESFVTQDTHLFNDTIANNIKIAKLDATDEEIMLAAKKASVHNFISSLEKGYETRVSELGANISGGERQRIGLARAFLHNSPLMLLDEPTSNLDSLNEAVILKALKEERAEKTVVLVSHRQSTMKIVNRSYSIENGRVS